MKGQLGCKNEKTIRLTQRNWSCSTLVLITVLIEKGLEFLNGKVCLIHQHVVVGWTSSSLDGHMRAEVDIILPRMSHVVLDQGARHRVSILVASQSWRREEADMMTLLGDNNCHLGLSIKLANVTRSNQTKIHTLLAGSRWPISSMSCLISATSCLSKAVY